MNEMEKIATNNVPIVPTIEESRLLITFTSNNGLNWLAMDSINEKS